MLNMKTPQIQEENQRFYNIFTREIAFKSCWKLAVNTSNLSWPPEKTIIKSWWKISSVWSKTYLMAESDVNHVRRLQVDFDSRT